MESTVLVFGAAGGIGRAAMDGFLARGHQVIAIDPRQPDQLPTGVIHLEQRADSPAHRVFTEIAKSAAPVSHVAISVGGAIDDEVVLDSAVLSQRRTDLLQETLNTNLLEAIAIAIGALPLMQPDGNASITIASSINARGDFGYPFYSAAKAALEGFVASSARPIGQLGVRINAIAFGTVRTRRSIELHQSDEVHYRRLERLTATGRLTTPEEAGASMVTMALDLTNVTGTVLICDGGQSIPGDHSIT